MNKFIQFWEEFNKTIGLYKVSFDYIQMGQKRKVREEWANIEANSETEAKQKTENSFSQFAEPGSIKVKNIEVLRNPSQNTSNKTMSEIKKESLIVAAWRFRNELKELNLSPTEVNKFLEEFIKWFERSEDYDLAVSRVFSSLMPGISRSRKNGNFKTYWRTLSEKAQKKTVHFNDLSMNEYISIRDQLKDLIRQKHPLDPEKAAYEIASHYNLFYNDVFQLAWKFSNELATEKIMKSFRISKEDEEKLEHRAREVYEEEKKPGYNWGQLLLRIAKVLVVEFGVTLAAALMIANKISKK